MSKKQVLAERYSYYTGMVRLLWIVIAFLTGLNVTMLIFVPLTFWLKAIIFTFGMMFEVMVFQSLEKHNKKVYYYAEKLKEEQEENNAMASVMKKIKYVMADSNFE